MNSQIHPNRFIANAPPPDVQEEPSNFRDAAQIVQKMRAARIECATLLLLCCDMAVLSHQISLDVTWTFVNCSSPDNSTMETATVADAAKDCMQFAPVILFGFVTAIAAVFCIESAIRIGYNQVNKVSQQMQDIFDAVTSSISLIINITCLLTAAHPLLRDFLGCVIILRLCRCRRLCNGLSSTEKQQMLKLLDDYRREELFLAEKQQMLQTELYNREQECSDLKQLVRSATMARNKLRQKNQQQQVLQAAEIGDAQTRGDGNSRHAECEDSGHSSDSNPDTANDHGSGFDGQGTPQSANSIELSDIRHEDENSKTKSCDFTSRM